ncbi:cysteine desulfurase [Citrobacter portucalensis]|uniref:cysteine desulfurase family protein n=1 Tax=Citrobacter portucalensis TaxID=1639133 RepID=UPI00226B1357|nr:cysteine desulfurase family protein [Citrobacter portucalensis]MCX9063900.1 cysteine desulfurase [Citrobacter portucalensis]
MNNYFDYAASSPVASEVLDVMQPWFHYGFANPSASHLEALKASKAIQLARETIADKIGAMASEIIFTSGASESNNMALKGTAFKFLEKKGHIITSSIEHKCIINTCLFLQSLGFEVTFLTPDNNGLIKTESIINAIRENTILISIHHVNNEIGSVQNIKEIGRVAFERNIPFHTDAAQSFCKLDIDVDDLNIDMLSLSGHKIFGPKGIGALYVRNSRSVGLVPLIHGGGQELGLRGGTSPTPLIIGLGAAVEYFPQSKSTQHFEFEEVINRYDFIRNGNTSAVVPTIWNITFSSNEEVLRFVNDHAWLISQGSACNAMSNTPSHVLTAIGLDEATARRTYRISLPPYHITGELS